MRDKKRESLIPFIGVRFELLFFCGMDQVDDSDLRR
jgi:hypothetical protein